MARLTWIGEILGHFPRENRSESHRWQLRWLSSLMKVPGVTHLRWVTQDILSLLAMSLPSLRLMDRKIILLMILVIEWHRFLMILAKESNDVSRDWCSMGVGCCRCLEKAGAWGVICRLVVEGKSNFMFWKGCL